MHIAIDARLWSNDYVQQALLRLVRKHSEHRFVLFTAEVFPASVPLPSNSSIVVLTPKPTSLLSFKWWYDVKLTAALKKHKADVFVGTSGLLSLRTSVPQVLLVQDLSDLVNPAFYRGRGLSFYKKYTAVFVKKSTKIAAVSEFVKQQLNEVYKAGESKVSVIGAGASKLYLPIDWQERERVKEQYAAGCEYFVFNGELCPRTNPFNLLKAFSIFKKRQKTNMKLVMTGDVAPTFQKDITKLETYKYKSDVVLKLNAKEEEKAALTAGSYALVYPSLYEAFAMPVLEAMQCEVPVITTTSSSMEEVAGDAALYADAANPEQIAEHMKRLFKDEQLRGRLIEAGKQQSKMFSWEKTADVLWGAIEEAVSG